MRLRIIWILLTIGTASQAVAILNTETRSTALTGATIREIFQSENASSNRRIEVVFGERRIIAERKIDETSTPPNGFGNADGPSPMVMNGQRIAVAGFQKQLSEPTWLLDSRGEGFYFPAQPELAILGKPGISPAFYLESNARNESSIWMELGKISEKDIAAQAALMPNPTLGPLQVTDNDDNGLIVYDTLTKTSAYAIIQSSERMNSTGYLNGANLPCVVLIRSSPGRLVVSAGKTQASGNLRLKLFGDWEAAPTETGVLKCEQKAGRTWIEFTAGPEGCDPINLVALPPKSFLRRILEMFVK